MAKKLVFTQEEFDKLPDAQPKVGRQKMAFSQEEFDAIPDAPDVTIDADLGPAKNVLESIKETGMEGAKWLAKQAERPSAAWRNSITDYNKRPSIDLPNTAKEGFKGFMDPEKAAGTTETLESMGVSKENANDPWVKLAADMTILDPLAVLGVGGKAAAIAKAGGPKALKAASATQKLGQLNKIAGSSDLAINNFRRNEDVLHAILQEPDVDNLFRKPNDLKKLLTGDQVGSVSDGLEHFPVADAGDFVEGGKIAQEARKADEIVAKASKRLTKEGKDLNAMELEDLLIEPIQFRETVAGTGVDSSRAQSQREIVSRFLGNLGAGPGMGSPDRKISLQQLQDFKRQLGKRLSSKDFTRQGLGDQMAQEKEILTEMYGKVKGMILNKADAVSMGKDLDAVNKKMQGYYTLDQLLTKPAAVQFQVLSQGFPTKDVLQAGAKIGGGAMVGTTQGISQAVGDAGAVGGAGVGYMMSRPEIDNIKKYLQYSMPDNVPEKAYNLENSLQMLAQERQARPPEQRAAGYNFGNVESIMKTPLPRSTEALLNQKDFAINKVTMALGPEAGEEFGYMLNNTAPEDLSALMGKFVVKNPSLFERDPRNRWDGKMSDAIDRQATTQQVRRRKDVPATQRAKTIMKVHLDGRID